MFIAIQAIFEERAAPRTAGTAEAPAAP